MATGTVRTRSTAVTEWFKKGNGSVPYCAVHTGDGVALVAPGGRNGLNPAVLGAVPIRPKSPALLGEDPYDSEPVVLAGQAAAEGQAGLFPQRSQVLESMELGDQDSAVRLHPPRKLKIDPD
jgi:hypothetical protein